MVGVFAAITDKDNRILLTKIGYGSRNWTFPGGQLVNLKRMSHQ